MLLHSHLPARMLEVRMSFGLDLSTKVFCPLRPDMIDVLCWEKGGCWMRWVGYAHDFIKLYLDKIQHLNFLELTSVVNAKHKR